LTPTAACLASSAGGRLAGALNVVADRRESCEEGVCTSRMQSSDRAASSCP
jgi:hypothetical protein